MTPEGKLKDQVKRLLKSRGAWWYMPVQNGMGVVGIPDLIVCHRGIFLGMETKAPVKNPRTPAKLWAKATPNQRNRIREIWGAGGCAAVIESVSAASAMLESVEVDLVERRDPNAMLVAHTLMGVKGLAMPPEIGGWGSREVHG